jgi:hypothetical protein
MRTNALVFALLTIALAQGSTSASAQRSSNTSTPIASPSFDDQLKSAKMLDASVAEISGFRLREAEALARYLADCWGGLSDNPLERAACGHSINYFRVVGPPGGALLKLFDVLNFEAVYFMAVDKSRNRTAADQALGESITRIHAAWADALRVRLAVLDGQQR